MPNWCSNELRITPNGDSEASLHAMKKWSEMVAKAAKDAADSEGLFQQSLPRPEILNNTISGFSPVMETPEYKAKVAQAIAETGHKDWYEWNCAKWGVKWDAHELYVAENSEDLIEVFFETAWCPPDAWLKAMREASPELDFWLFYREDGVEAAGYL